MKFKVSSSVLLKQLQGISGVLSANNALPILDNFLFSLDKKDLKISASDLETSVTISVGVDSKDTGAIAIPAKLLLEMLKALPDQPVTFSFDKAKNSVIVSSDYGSYRLSVNSSDEFPIMPQIDKASSFEVSAEILERAINKTLFAAGDDDLRPVMCGVYVKMESAGTTFVATDAHKLVRYKRTDIKADKEASFIIPKKPLGLLRGILGSGKVVVSYNDTNVSFNWENTQIVSRLIDGKYPNYEAVIPTENPNILKMDRQELLNSSRRISIFSNKSTHLVKLSITKSEITVGAEDLDSSNEANEKIKCDYVGENMEMGFNARLLSEVVSVIDGDEVIIEMSTPNKAGIFKSSANSKDEDILMLVMPIMLNQ